MSLFEYPSKLTTVALVDSKGHFAYATDFGREQPFTRQSIGSVCFVLSRRVLSCR